MGRPRKDQIDIDQIDERNDQDEQNDQNDQSDVILVNSEISKLKIQISNLTKALATLRDHTKAHVDTYNKHIMQQHKPANKK